MKKLFTVLCLAIMMPGCASKPSVDPKGAAAYQIVKTDNLAEISAAIADGRLDPAMVVTSGPNQADILMLTLNATDNPEIIKLLLDNGANANATYDGINTLDIALKLKKNHAIIKLLVDRGADVNFKTQTGTPILVTAAKNTDDPKIITELVKAGANIKAIDRNLMDPLTAAAMFNPNLAIFKELAKFRKPEADKTYLQMLLSVTTVRAANPLVVREIIKMGTDVNKPVDNGETPFMWAAWFSGDPAFIKEFLNAGGDVTIKSSKGKNALDYLKENKKLENSPDLPELERLFSERAAKQK